MAPPLHCMLDPRPAAAVGPLADSAAVSASAVTLEAALPCEALSEGLVAYYVTEALHYQRQALAWLHDTQEPRPGSLTPRQHESVLAPSLEQAGLACRLLEQAQQEARSRPCACLEQRLGRVRILAAAIEQEL